MALPVCLNVYDVTNTPSADTNQMVVKVNNITHMFGIGGVFHGGIAVDGLEWSFGYCETGSGVYSCEPKKNPMYQFRETIDLGTTPKTKPEVRKLLLQLRRQWPGSTYEVLSNNCCHFCEAFTQALECKPIPGWLNRLAQGADATITFTNEAVELARSVGSTVSRSACWLRDSVTKLFDGDSTGSSEDSRRQDCMPSGSSTSSDPPLNYSPLQQGLHKLSAAKRQLRQQAMPLAQIQHSSGDQKKQPEVATTPEACGRRYANSGMAAVAAAIEERSARLNAQSSASAAPCYGTVTGLPAPLGRSTGIVPQHGITVEKIGSGSDVGDQALSSDGTRDGSSSSSHGNPVAACLPAGNFGVGPAAAAVAAAESAGVTLSVAKAG